MSTAKKRQHFVPEAAHLSKFCNAEGYLHVYDKDNLTSFPAKPKDVANKHRFYDFPFEEDREWQTIENKLEEFESLQKTCIENNIANIKSQVNDNLFCIEVLDLEQKNDLAHIIGVQFVRTLEHRKFMSDWFKSTKHTLRKEAEEIVDQIIKESLEITPSEDRFILNDLFAKTKENSINGAIKYINWLYSEGLPIVQGDDMFRRCKYCAEMLVEHIWIIGINTFSENKSFYTSDHPVAKNSPLLGIASKGIEISFP